MKITYVFTTKVEKEDELVGRTSLNIKQRIIVISPDDVCQIASESEEYTKQWLSELRKLLKAKYSTEELRQKEEAKKVRDTHVPITAHRNGILKLHYAVSPDRTCNLS